MTHGPTAAGIQAGGIAEPRGIAEPPRYPEKRASIARAALHLFVRDGYERTSVDAIAAQAGVSKRTVYNHYGDKEQLFLRVVEDTYNALMDQVLAISDRELDAPGDIEQRLLAFIGEVARTITRSPERAALFRLVLTEAPHFPALLTLWQGRQSLTPVLARALSTLPAGSNLDIADADRAAEHLTALTFGQINSRSLFSLLPVSEEDLDSIITGGVGVFARAYRRA
jgi:AcrR family transcriptional regulator